jgi:hypothetical protein
MKFYLLGIALVLFAFAPPSNKARKVRGNDTFLKKKVTIFIEFDFSKTSLDGLDSEEEFIEYKRKKEKNKKEADKWEAAWNKDTEGFLEYYQVFLSKKCKKYPASFNIDDPDSDYKMVVQPIHIQTGTAVKKSSVETKIFFFDTKTNERVAELYMPKSDGAQMGPLSPTTGMRVKMSLGSSASIFAKYYKGLLKK